MSEGGAKRACSNGRRVKEGARAHLEVMYEDFHEVVEKGEERHRVGVVPRHRQQVQIVVLDVHVRHLGILVLDDGSLLALALDVLHFARETLHVLRRRVTAPVARQQVLKVAVEDVKRRAHRRRRHRSELAAHDGVSPLSFPVPPSFPHPSKQGSESPRCSVSPCADDSPSLS